MPLPIRLQMSVMIALYGSCTLLNSFATTSNLTRSSLSFSLGPFLSKVQVSSSRCLWKSRSSGSLVWISMVMSSSIVSKPLNMR